MSTKSILSWFHDNYYNDASQRVPAEEVYNAFSEFFGTCHKKTIGKYITSAFPNSYRSRQRRPKDWTKYDYMYMGIAKRSSSQHSEHQYSLAHISPELPDGYFLLEKNDTFLRYGTYTSVTCNGNKVIIEIEVHDSGSVEITMGGKVITEYCSVTSPISVSSFSVSTLLTSLTSLRYCQGVIPKQVSSLYKENIVVQKNHYNDNIAYAISCRKVIDFNSHKSAQACISCRSLLRNKVEHTDTHNTISDFSITKSFSDYIPAPSTVSIPAPSTDSIPAPSTVSIPAPSTVSIPAPSTDSIPVPSTDSIPVPSTDFIPAPSSVSIPAPSTDSIPVPSTDSIPVPSTDFIPVPSTDSIPVPSTDSIPAPSTDSIPAPSTDSIPAPSTDFIPAPSSVSIPAPSTDSIPAPSTDSIPAPSTYSIPVPSTDFIPAPSSVSIPAPSTDSIPAPSTDSIPAPSTYSIPAPSTDFIPAPSTDSIPAPSTYSIPAPSPDIPFATSTTSTEDIISLIREKAPFLTDVQMSFFGSQLKNSNIKDVHGRRWDFETIKLCLPLWTRSPKTYEELATSGSLVLPSISTLQRYKNAVAQEAGINKDVFKWMFMEATHQNLPKEGFYGGLILDEMSIQEDLQILKKGGQVKLVGLTESTTSSGDTTLANHVLQFVFHGLTGFRFPVCHFPTKQANATQIYSSFWEIVQQLQEWGFHVVYSSVDGASTNRSFIKMHFTGSPSFNDMAAANPYHGLPVNFLADPSHIFKKIRNNLLKSGHQKWHSRHLLMNGHPIVWKMWIDCYEWDKQHGLAIHHKLTNEHLHPNKAELMRNHLAEEVLDDNMLNLMEAYKKHIGNSDAFDGALELLGQTSRLINIFHDRRPIKDLSDERLRQLRDIRKWFTKWEKGATKTQVMSWETMEDVQFLTAGFGKLVEMALSNLNITVTPMYINSDIVENHFSQQRGLYHGSGANPNYFQYRYANNSIILGQSTISKKSNASRGKVSKNHGALPFHHLCKKLRM